MLRLPNPSYFAPAMIKIVVKYLFCSMILEWSALLESPRTWDRRKMAIISCMQELHLETNLTTINSQSVAFEISAKFLRKREIIVLLVCI